MRLCLRALSRCLRDLTCAAALAVAVPALAAAQSSDLQQQIDSALKAKPPALTRGLGPVQPAANPHAAADDQLIDRLRSRSIAVEPAPGMVSVEERDRIAEMVKGRPKIDLEIYFDHNSAVVGPKASPALVALGTVLAKDEYRGTVFFLNGYTDAAGGADYNLALSQRRAEAVRRVLIEQFRLPPDTLIATGFGKDRLRFPERPLAEENRRVQIVNTERKSTAAR